MHCSLPASKTNVIVACVALCRCEVFLPKIRSKSGLVLLLVSRTVSDKRSVVSYRDLCRRSYCHGSWAPNQTDWNSEVYNVKMSQISDKNIYFM